MSDLLLSFGASNLLLSLVLAVGAWLVQRRGTSPWLAHLLWLLVLVKLVTPPLVTAPLFTVASDAAATTSSLLDDVSLARTTGAGLAPLPALGEGTPLAATDPTPSSGPALSAVAISLALWVWALGSLAVLVLSFVRITRFVRRLRACSRPADDRLVRMAAHLAKRLGLRRAPRLVVVDADLAPLVWWLGGRTELVLPRAIADGLDPCSLRLVVAHELAHLRRRDHLVRWVEWAATVLFWWNPVLWLARRGLRANEELCCDALVLSALDTDPNTYANSLLDALELLATPALRPPAVASQMTSGGSLEHRLTMIVNASTLAGPSRRLRAVVLAVAALVLPLGIASAQDPDYDAVGARLMEAVEDGELSEAQAKAMFGALAEEHFGAALASRRADAGGVALEDRYQRAEIADYKAEVDALVAAGLLTAAEGEKGLEALKYRVLGSEEAAAQRQRQARIDGQLQRLVNEGRISKEEASQRSAALRFDVGGELAPEMAERKQRYAKAEAEVKVLLESGWISRTDAEKRLASERQELFGPDPMETRKQRYVEAEAQINALFESGYISATGAATELDALRRELFGTVDGPRQLAERKRRQADAQAKVEALFEAEYMSEAGAKAQLEKLHLELFEIEKASKKAEAAAGVKKREKAALKDAYKRLLELELETELIELEFDVFDPAEVVEKLELLEMQGYVYESAPVAEPPSIDASIRLRELGYVEDVERLVDIGYVDEIVELGYVDEFVELGYVEELVELGYVDEDSGTQDPEMVERLELIELTEPIEEIVEEPTERLELIEEPARTVREVETADPVSVSVGPLSFGNGELGARGARERAFSYTLSF